MTNGFSRAAWPASLALGFALFIGMSVSLAGRLPAAALATAQVLGTLGCALILAGRPIAAVRALDSRSRVWACGAGLLGVFGPVAVISSARMSDAPAGSVVVFWIAGGWALAAAVLGAWILWRDRRGTRAGLTLAGGLVAITGVAGVVANWERPSSFSPLVQFPAREVAILAAGALLLAGAVALAKAAGTRGRDGALVCAAAAAVVAGAVWWAVDAPARGLSSLTEQAVPVALLAIAWGVVWVCLPRVLEAGGPPRLAAILAAAPVALSTLTWLELTVGVAGPQPLIASGVLAGAVTVAAGSVVLWWSVDAESASPGNAALRIVRWLPAVAAVIALAMPAVVAQADVNGVAGSFAGSWTLLGWESVAGLTAAALCTLLVAAAVVRRPMLPALAGLVACAAWTWSLGVPMHVLTGWLPAGIEQYYGTEYGSIDFTTVFSPLMVAAVVGCAVGLMVVIVSHARQRLVASADQSGK